MADDTLLKLSAELGLALSARGWALALAESCTGGGVAQCVTAIPGSSIWFDRGFVTYSNAAKIEMLGVLEQTLQQHGAVSEQTACEMASGALSHSHAHVAIAITGIAGPGGGTEDKPVGTVCFAWATPAQPLRSKTCHFTGDRGSVRRQAIETALAGLLRLTLATELWNN